MLYSKADSLRRKLYILVEQLGLNHPKVIRCSRELDEVILQIQLQKK